MTLLSKGAKHDLNRQLRKVAQGALDVRFVSSEDQVADAFTKPSTKLMLERLMTKLNLVSLASFSFSKAPSFCVPFLPHHRSSGENCGGGDYRRVLGGPSHWSTFLWWCTSCGYCGCPIQSLQQLMVSHIFSLPMGLDVRMFMATVLIWWSELQAQHMELFFFPYVGFGSYSGSTFTQKVQCSEKLLNGESLRTTSCRDHHEDYQDK